MNVLLKGFTLLFFLFAISCNLKTAYAIEDPLASSNNKFGIHIISPSYDEASEAASLVNSNGGDWGYITFVISSDDKKIDKWQQFFNTLRKKHLIPIVRLATKPSGETWQAPTDQDGPDWANFLDQLNWPVKNRYVTIYNEPNHASEWGGTADPAAYAKILDQTITALKEKSSDFFVLNAGLDASAPNQPPTYFDEQKFLTQMNEAVPGIFNKLDGWSSHSYPNPGFVGSPLNTGRGTIRTFNWEINFLKSLGLNKSLPVFISETGWKHAEGLSINPNLPSSETVGDYLKIGFEKAWNTNDIVAVTPFLLSYSQAPFDHFSFKKMPGEEGDLYYPQYQELVSLPKQAGTPKQIQAAMFVKGEVYQIIAINQEYTFHITFKNTGQTIWNEKTPVKLATVNANSLDFKENTIPANTLVEPNQEYTFDVKVKSKAGGKNTLSLNLFSGAEQFNSPSVQFDTEAKSPVSLVIQAGLQWKKDPSGDYTLSVDETINRGERKITIQKTGSSAVTEAYDLLPEYNFTFTLTKPNYKPKTIKLKTQPGVNTINFGTLEPDFFSALLNPKAFFSLLPF